MKNHPRKDKQPICRRGNVPTATLVALNELIEQVEAQIPANPKAPKYIRAARRIERIMQRYFKTLEDALSDEQWANLYYRHVTEATPIKDIDDFLDPLLRTISERLEAELVGELTDIYLSGSAEMTTWGQTVGGRPIAFEGPPIEDAINYAQKHGARLVTNMNDETKRRLGKVVSDGIKNKRGIDGIARDLRGTFDDMSRHRSKLIARTETADALSNAALDRGKDMGITHKEWITVGDSAVSDECAGNEAQGVIKMNQVFSSGAMAPPEHPNCRCALAPSMGKG